MSSNVTGWSAASVAAVSVPIKAGADHNDSPSRLTELIPTSERSPTAFEFSSADSSPGTGGWGYRNPVAQTIRDVLTVSNRPPMLG